MGNVYKPVVYLNTRETATPVSKPEDIDNIKLHEWFTFNCIICGAKVTIAKRNDKDRIERYKTLLCQPCYAKKVKLEKFGDPNFNNRAQAAQTCLENYGSTNWCSSEEGIAKKKEMWNDLSDEEKRNRIKKGQDTYEQRTGFRCSFNNPDVQTQIRETFQERYGCDYSGENPELFAKTCSTKEKEYGDKYYNNRPKYKETCLEEFGADNPMKNPEVAKKNSETWNDKSQEEIDARTRKSEDTQLERYGVRNVMDSPVFRQKISDTYNAKSDEEKDEIKQRRVETNLERFGSTSYCSSDEYRKRMLEEYGSLSYLQSQEYRDYMINKYGTLHPYSSFCYYGIGLDSSWELAIWVYCIDHDIPIVRNPCMFIYKDINEKDHIYKPDFMIDGKLVEIKGDQWFNPDGSMKCLYSKVHHDFDPMTPEEKVYLDDLYERKHQCGLQHGVEFWKGSDCQKYIEYCNLNHPGWIMMFRRDNPLNPSYWCSNILNPGYYQRQDFIPLVQSVTPYAKPDADGYAFSDTEMVTPFDIK